jgi:spore maturation protein SpmA
VVLASPAESLQLLLALTTSGFELLPTPIVGGRHAGAPAGATIAMLSVGVKELDVAVIPVLSVTWTAKSKVPPVVGVPEIIPWAFKLIPTGKVPERIDHV